ncbi:MAG: potassium-transporting ATPase subunit KdpC [Gammaproteobacteria bacterium]|nr:potassium-transporting ATPase subunit KdpC [Gammaproteobacteria bacterium]
MMHDLKAATILLLFLAALTGLVYPLAMTGIGREVFPARAGGSLMRVGGRVVGSRLIGQYFRGNGYFWSRPSATAPVPYNADGSSPSNLSPDNPVLLRHVGARVKALRAADPGARGRVPVDLVTSSGSGLDPDISLAAARYQLDRVAACTGIAKSRLQALLARYTSRPFAAFMGEPVVNVLAVNLALDRLRARHRPPGGGARGMCRRTPVSGRM